MSDPFDGVVESSSRLIAAFRAVETAEGCALIKDELAAALAGKQALEEVEHSLPAYDPATCLAQGQPVLQRRTKASRFAFRARWFDDRILAALAGGTGQQQQQQQAVPRQVVLLGSGMDTRAWRLALPPGVWWCEVDRPGVLAAKQAVLSRQGAQAPANNITTAASSTQTPCPATAATNGVDSATDCAVGRSGNVSSSSACDGAWAHPLRAAQWWGVEHDVTKAGWVDALARCGWRREQPTVWVAEGLIVYLEQRSAEWVLHQITDNSAPGSVMVLGLLTEDSIAIFAGEQYAGAALVKEFRSGVPRDAAPYFAQLGWRLCEEFDYVGITEEYMCRGMQASLAAASQLDVSEHDLRHCFRFFTAVKP